MGEAADAESAELLLLASSSLADRWEKADRDAGCEEDTNASTPSTWSWPRRLGGASRREAPFEAAALSSGGSCWLIAEVDIYYEINKASIGGPVRVAWMASDEDQ